jgi:hypothetical protein
MTMPKRKHGAELKAEAIKLAERTIVVKAAAYANVGV